MIPNHWAAIHGARKDIRVSNRSMAGSASNTPVSVGGSAPAMIATRVTR
jgi:hypothetical protein